MKYLGLLFFSILLLCCGKDKGDQMIIEDQLILDYIDSSGLDAIALESGLYVVIDEPGTDRKPIVDSEVTICYNGLFLDNSIFETTYNSDNNCTDPLTVSLLSVIDGWKEGVLLFGEDGKGKIIVPSHLAYCDQQSGPIPPNTVTVFDIWVLNF